MEQIYKEIKIQFVSILIVLLVIYVCLFIGLSRTEEKILNKIDSPLTVNKDTVYIHDTIYIANPCDSIILTIDSTDINYVSKFKYFKIKSINYE